MPSADPVADAPAVASPSPAHTYWFARRLFLVLLGAVFFIAFVSFWAQADGLVGSHGLFPIEDFLARAREVLHGRFVETTASGSEPGRLLRVPTVFWLGASDRAIHLVCLIGTLLSALLVAGIAPRLALIGLWGLYLSISSTGSIFLGYQWDALLLETALLAIFIAPSELLPRWMRRRPPPPPRAFGLARFLLLWLLLKLMFLSGMVKLLSGDESWRDLSALTYHYWSQPIPTWTAYYVDHLPRWVHAFSCAVMFAIELATPALLALALALEPALPRRPVRWLRLACAGALVVLQLIIFATGNYGFFNLLSIALCVLALDDAALLRLAPAGMRARMRAALPTAAPPRWSWRTAAFLPLFAALFAASTVEGVERLGARELPGWLDGAMADIASFRSINSYGLFAVMTKQRLEIALEGSDDGAAWRAYEFKWKPGRLDRAPAFVEPHMPRVDWQMWFAALGTCRHNPWFLRLQERLLQGSPPVAALLATNPFPDHPPRYLRSLVYDYRFSSLAEKRATGAWWTRTGGGERYCPTVTLEGGRLAEANVGQ
jgi:hypothetical protein